MLVIISCFKSHVYCQQDLAKKYLNGLMCVFIGTIICSLSITNFPAKIVICYYYPLLSKYCCDNLCQRQIEDDDEHILQLMNSEWNYS